MKRLCECLCQHTLPHPSPLPLGEGESITEAVENLRRSWFNDGTEKQTMRWLFPLPQGEGQGEGELFECRERPMLKQSPNATRIARNLRKQESWAEQLMWTWLRANRFADYKFRRQHPIGPHILNFFCNAAKLDIEVDGFQHGTPAHQAADSSRDAFLESQGIKVLRFWSSRLSKDREMIRDAIWRTLQARAPRPMPDYARPGLVGRKEQAQP